MAWPPLRVVIGEDLSEDAHSAAELGVTLGKLMEAETLLVGTYEAMPPHPQTVPRAVRELYEAMVEMHLGVVRRSLRMIMSYALRFESSLGGIPKRSLRLLKKTVGRLFWWWEAEGLERADAAWQHLHQVPQGCEAVRPPGEDRKRRIKETNQDELQTEA